MVRIFQKLEVLFHLHASVQGVVAFEFQDKIKSTKWKVN